MDSTMVASFVDELAKIAGEGFSVSNFADPQKPAVGGMGSNIMAKPLSSPGMGKPSTKAKPAKPTNYSMVHSTEPRAALNAGAGSKMVPPPPVRT